MTVVRGFLITLSSGITGSVVGTSIGYGVGRFFPFYYQTVFDLPENSVRSDLIELAMGMGMLQGLGGGLAIGLVIVLVVAWYQQRLATASFSSQGAQSSSGEGDAPP